MTSPTRPETGLPGRHPDTERLIASIAGELRGAEARAVTSHTSRCRPCRERARAMKVLFQAGAAGALEAVPDNLRQEADRIYGSWRRREFGDPRVAARATASGAGWSILRVRLAPAIAPWSPMSLPAGYRSVAVPTRCILDGGGYRIEIEWTASGRLCTVRGRLVREREDAEDRPRLALEFPESRLRSIATGSRGFFGPITAPSPRLRAVLTTVRKTYRSRWLELT